MKVANTPSAPLYPELSVEPASVFRLQKVSEIETSLRTEVENRERLHKKYRRCVNSLDGICGMLGTTCVVTGTVGAGLLASGIGFVVGLVLETVTGVAGLLDFAGVVVSRRCSAKAAKHKAVFVLASAKLNTVHSHISKALEDCNISDDEYKLVLEEIEKYRTVKEEIRRKHLSAASSMIDDETKNALIQKGIDEARACFAETIKKLASSESSSL